MSAPSFRIAVVATVYRPDSHADVIVSRWLAPMPTDHLYGWGAPRTQIASIYVEQKPENDMAVAQCEKYGLRLASSIEEALTLGTGSLAVDAVILIGEHGEYPENEFRQKMYPRKELLDAVVAVFRASGKVVPLFFDKHFSYDMALAHEMYWTIRDEKIPFLGGSSLPFAELEPQSLCIAGPGSVQEVVVSYHDSLEAYLYHALEVNETIVSEKTGSPGFVSVTAWQGEDFWKAVDAKAFSWELLESIAARLVAETGSLERFRELRAERSPEIVGFQFLGGDGVKTTYVWHRDTLPGWAYGVQCVGEAEPQVAKVAASGREHFFGHFAHLNRVIEDFFLSGKPPIPLERLYMSTMTTAVAMHALAQPGCPIPLPWLKAPIAREVPPSTVPTTVPIAASLEN